MYSTVKMIVLTYIFVYFPLCDYSAICCMNGKTIQCLSKPWQHLPIYLKQFSSYWNRKCKKYPFSRTTAYIFVCCRDASATTTIYKKRVGCLLNPHSMYLSILNTFRVIWCLSECVSAKKNNYFYHIFVSLGGRPCGNHVKCCMYGKRIRCLQIVSQHVLI